MYQLASELRGMNVGELAIAAYPSVATTWLPEIVRKFQMDYPGIQINIMEGIRSEIFHHLDQHVADMGFLAYSEPMNYEWVPLAEEEMIAAVPENHPLAGADAYPIKNCKKEDIIMPSEGDDADVRELFKRHGIVPNIRLTTLENYTAINMVEKGLGIAVMNDGITRYWQTDTVLLPIDPPSKLELGITLPDLESAAPAVKEFVTFAAERLHTHI
jgi:DNA-binding transcriptional LysR family regulator